MKLEILFVCLLAVSVHGRHGKRRKLVELGDGYDDNISVADPDVTSMVYNQPEVESVYANDNTAGLYNQPYTQGYDNGLGGMGMPLQNDINEYGGDLQDQSTVREDNGDEIAQQLHSLRQLEKKLDRKIRKVKRRRRLSKKKHHKVRRLIDSDWLYGGLGVAGALLGGKAVTHFSQQSDVDNLTAQYGAIETTFNNRMSQLEASKRDTTNKLNNLALKVGELAETTGSMLGDLDIWTASHVLNHRGRKH